MNRIVKRSPAILMLIVLMLVAIGCAANNTNTSSNNVDKTTTSPASTDGNTANESDLEEIELEFWTINLKKNFEEYITQSIIAAYEAENPHVTIKWVDVPGTEVTKKFITALSSNDVPDLVNEASGAISQLQGYNALMPISDILEPSAFEPYIDGLIDGVTYDGKVLGLPWYNGGPLVQFINTELYEKAGLDPSKPATTYDEFFANGKQIHEKLPDVYGSNEFPLIGTLVSEGLPIVSDDRKEAVFNSPEHVAFIDKFVEAYKNGSIAPGAIGKDSRQMQQSMDNGLIAQSGQHLSTHINNWATSNPTILEKLSVVPAITGKADKVTINGYQTFVIPRKSEHPEEAAKFALFVTSHEKQLEFAKIVSIFPSLEETLEDPFFTDIEVTDLKSAARKVQVETAGKLALSTFGFNNELTMTDYYSEQIRAAYLGEKTVQQALDDAKAFWDAELAKQ